MNVTLSVGKSTTDNRPGQRSVPFENVPQFIAGLTATEKGRDYFCCGFEQGPPNNGRRSSEGALPAHFISLDFDAFVSVDQFERLRPHLQQYRGVWWQTHSSTASAPRVRAVLMLSRAVDRDEYRAVCTAVAAAVEEAIGPLPDSGQDTSVFKPEQPLFCRPPNNPAEFCHGRPVAVDERLAGQVAKPRTQADHQAQQIDADPAARTLRDRGMLGRQIRPGLFTCLCPFRHEHSTPQSDPHTDSSTAYRQPKHDGALYGKFICQHAHCQGREQADYLRELGLNPADVWRAQAGRLPDARDTADGFKDLTATEGAVVLTRASSLTPKAIYWVWHGWLPAGKLVLCAGQPGQGKTTIAICFAAQLSRGGRWPDGTPCVAGTVVIWSGEDDPEDTLIPRLVAAGADLSRIFFVGGAYRDGEVNPFDPAHDSAELVRAIRKLGDVRMVIVDPIVSAVAGDSHKNTEVRRALQPLVDLAAEIGCVLLGITHLSKGTQGRDPGERVTGSIAFTAVARVVLIVAKVKASDGTEYRILCRAKSNIGPDEGALEYRLEQVEACPGINASRVVWGDVIEGNARELMAEAEKEPGKSSRPTERADWLRALLASGPLSLAEIEHEAGRVGYSMRSLQDTSRAMRVKKVHNGFGPGAYWTWELPPPMDVAALFDSPQP